MSKISIGFLPLIIAGAAFAALGVSPASADEGAWGPWQKTSKCRTLRMQVGPGRGNLESPRVPGVEQAYECIWERTKKDCPKLRDKVKRPIKCFNRKEKSGWSVKPPR